MSRNYRIAVVRATHDGSTIADAACRDFVMTGNRSLFRFWSDTSNGWTDFLDSAMFPWVSITVAPDAVDRYSTAGSAVAALRALDPGRDPLSGFHGLLILVHPGVGLDGGAGALGALPFALVPTLPSDHTFFCHELGHVLGAEHTWGVDNSGADWGGTGIVDPMYGSPYDLMSSGSFGRLTRARHGKPQEVEYEGRATFVAQTGSGWPEAPAGISMGPALSRANLHRWFPEAMRPHTREETFPADGTVARNRLLPASSTSGTTLLILHPPAEPSNGVGRVYVEYRTAEGWDAGLGPAAGLSRPGIVVHTLEDVPGHGPRVWYRGSVADGDPDTDLAVAGRSLVLSVTARGEGGDRWVEVTAARSATRTGTVRIEQEDRITGPAADIRREETPCGDVVTWGTWPTASTARCRVVTTGLEPPITAPGSSVSWSVGGVALAAPGASTVQVAATDGVARTVTCTVDQSTWELTIATGAGERYSVPVGATVQGISATGVLTAPGVYTGLGPDDLRALSICAAEHPREIVDIGAIDIASLLDNHEVWSWKQAEETLAGLFAGSGGPLAQQFGAILNVTVEPVVGTDTGPVDTRPIGVQDIAVQVFRGESGEFG